MLAIEKVEHNDYALAEIFTDESAKEDFIAMI